jgi:hypothetical protein
VNVSHSREIYQNINKHTHKILLEVEGLHNDTRPTKSINTIRDFMIQYSYDALIVKEHRRRLYIKNAQINYNAKYRIDINSILESFRSNQEKEKENEINLEKNRKSILKYNENLQKITDRKNSIDSNNNNDYEIRNSKINSNSNFINNNKGINNICDINKFKEVKFEKSLINEYQSEYKKENRRLNNFKIDLNYNTQQGNFDLNFNININNIGIDSNELLLLNKRNKNMIRLKSQENLKKISIDKDNENHNNLITNILFDNSKIISINNNNDNNIGIRKRSNSFSISKNIKFYPNNFIQDDIKSFILLSKNIDKKFPEIDDINNNNSNYDYRNIDKEQIKLNCLIENYNNLKLNDLDNKNTNIYINKESSSTSNFSNNNNNNKKSYLRSSYSIFNNNNDKDKERFNNKDINKDKDNDNYIEKINEEKNKNYTKNHFNNDYSNFDIKDNNNTYIDYNKTFNDYGFKLENNIDNSKINDDRNNYTDINNTNANKISANGRGKIKSRRNQVLSGILNFDVKLGSSHIKITDLDKSSLRKNRDSNKSEKEEN